KLSIGASGYDLVVP
ncbi:hypothetical protein SOJ29_03930, partial [Treponema pallidum]